MDWAGRQLDWSMTPLEALSRWPVDRRVLLLHSGRYHSRWARWSILAQPVGTFRFTSMAGGDRRGRSQWLGTAQMSWTDQLTHRPFHDLRVILEHTEGLWIGYLSYDLGRWVERLPSRATDDRHWPIIELAYCPGYLVYDGANESWSACGTWGDGGEPDLAGAVPRLGNFTASGVRGVITQAQYEASVARIIEYIAAGDSFQVNFTHRFTADFTGEYPLAHRALYHRLAEVSPAWYGAYLELADSGAPGQLGRVIASTSPELFLKVDAAGNVVTRPIKGTRPATAKIAELEHSAKDIAELNMIVDLLRNDLGRVCAYGTVKVPQPRIIESHPTVHHGVATITGTLHGKQDLVGLLRATIPGGSITGAPKVRTMQIIDELEPVRRGPYCGCIGFLSGNATCLNIAIRTLLLETPTEAHRGRVDFSVGGGILADSEPALEYQESLDKAAAMLKALDLELSLDATRL